MNIYLYLLSRPFRWLAAKVRSVKNRVFTRHQTAVLSFPEPVFKVDDHPAPLFMPAVVTNIKSAKSKRAAKTKVHRSRAGLHLQQARNAARITKKKPKKKK